MPHANDGSISYETIIERYNSDLANTLGNLVNRTVAMTNKYFDGEIMAPTAPDALDEELKAFALETVAKVDKNISSYHMADAVEAVINLAKRCNKYIDETAPWALAKDEANKERLGTVLYNLLEGIRFISVLLEAFMPDTSKAILSQINCDIADYDSLSAFGALKAGGKVGTATPLFARIDAEKMLADIEEQQKAAQANEKTIEEIEGIAKIGIEDFMKVDLRVAQITDCEPVKRAKKLLKLTLNDGTGTPRTVASGIAKWYKPEDLIGKSVIVVSNLKPATLCGVESQGMILAADVSEDDVKVIFVDGVPAGSKVR
jgi:methionyl-tRNA synthetase